MSLLNTQGPNFWDDVTHQTEFLTGNCSFYLAISPSGQGRWSFSLGETQLDCWVQYWAPQHKKDMDISEHVQQMVTQMMKEQEHLSYEKRQRELGLFHLEKQSLRGIMNFFTESDWALEQVVHRECGVFVLQDYLNPDGTQLWETCCSWPYSGQEAGLDNFQRWLTTSAI